jgi:hypothetical protein
VLLRAPLSISDSSRGSYGYSALFRHSILHWVAEKEKSSGDDIVNSFFVLQDHLIPLSPPFSV